MRYYVYTRMHPENSWRRVEAPFDCKQSAQGYVQAAAVAAKIFFPLFEAEIEPAECSHGRLIDVEDCRGCAIDAEVDAKLDAWRGK